jgi:hypothetical protein
LTGKEWERIVEAWLGAVGGWDCRFEPKVQNGYKMEGGTPDFGLYLGTDFHLIECKKETAASMTLAKNKNSDGSGISPAQAAEMDRATSRGVRCWVAARLELSDVQRRKLAQQPIFGDGGDVPAAIQQLVPWALWRARMAAAEEARLRGGDVQASIPAVELAGLGYPLRSAAELRRALEAP